MMVEMMIGTRVELLERIMSASAPQTDGCRRQEHCENLIEQQGATGGQREQSVVVEPVGYFLSAT